MIPTEAARFLLANENVRAMEEGQKHYSETAWHIWKTKYAAEGEECPEDTNIRIVKALEEGNEEAGEVYDALLPLMNKRVVAFNSPVYFNLGVRENPQCSACFILGVDDTMDSLSQLAATEMEIFRKGSGAGCNYSSLRPNGAPLSNKGIASGPVSFLRSLDAMAGAIKSGGKCLPGDQCVYTGNGPISVKELAEKGEDFIVFSFDPPEGRIKAKKAKAWLSGVKRIVEVRTDKGIFRLSEDHPVRLSTGEYRHAGKLEPGNSLHKATISRGRGEYPRIGLQDGKKTKIHLHRLIAQDLLSCPTTLHVHHKNCDCFDNRLSNLSLLTHSAHARLHSKGRVEKNEHIFQKEDFSHSGANNGMHREGRFWKDEKKVADYKEKQRRILLESSGRAAEMQKMSSRKRMLNHAFFILNNGGSIDTFSDFFHSKKKIHPWYCKSLSEKTYSAIIKYFGTYENFVKEVSAENHRVQEVVFLEEEHVYSVEVMCPTPDDKSPDSGHNYLIWDRNNKGRYGSGVFVSNTRRAARIAILDSDHPDIWDFIDCKVIEEKRLRVLAEAGELPADHFDNPAAFFQNTNHTVRLFDSDMEENKKLIRHIAEAIWECGDPGVHFADTVKKGLGERIDVREWVHSSNPCSEFIFLDNSACNLASINVAHKFFDGAFAGERLKAVAEVMTYVMDRIVDISSYPTKEIEENSKKYRPLGLGITGFAEYCLNHGIVYGSKSCCAVAEIIMQNIQTAAKATCPDNYQHTLIAPTGTISLFLDAESTGIEPIYADKVFKRMADDKPIMLEPECIKRAREEGRGDQVRCATGPNCVTPKEHIDVVAAAQEFCCGGISKTVNLPHEATIDEIEQLIYYAWKKEVKAITFYRDGSKAVQPLTVKPREEVKEPSPPQDVPSLPVTSRMRLDQERGAITRKFSVGGEEGYITVGLYSDGSPGEVFIRVSKVGSTLQGFIDQLGIAWSLALQHGVPLAALVEKGRGSRFDPSGYTGDDIRYASSIVDYLAKWLESRFLVDDHEEDDDEGEEIEVEIIEAPVSYSGPPCKMCGGLTQPSGTCYVCLACGETTGCS